jgi:hypothetical protein
MTDKPTPQYIENIAGWYDRAARRYRYAYLGIKMLQLLLAASIPVVSLALGTKAEGHQALINGILGSSLLVAEGVQQTFQLQPLWTRYRAAYNAIRREQMLYESGAGPYSQVPSPTALFSERVGTIIAEENSAWMAIQEQAKKEK